MKQRSFITILIVAVAVVAIYFLLFRSNTYSFYLWVNDAKGLHNGVEVKVSGEPVGSVKDMKLYGNRILMKFAIQNDVRFSKNSQFVFTSEGLSIPVVLIQSASDTFFIREGDTVDPMRDSMQRKKKDTINPEQLPALADSITRMLEELKQRLK